MPITVSTQQRMPKALGGEEYVYVGWSPGAGPSIKREIDNNGRWTEHLGASVAEDRSWVRLYLADPSAPLGTVPRRYRSLAYVELATGEVVRFAFSHSTAEERAAGWFASTSDLATDQTLRGHAVRWRPCQ